MGCGLCCKTIGLPDTGEYTINTDEGTVTVPLHDNPSDAWLKFLAARGAHVENGTISLKFRPGAREPVIRIRYGPNRVPILLVKHTCPQLDEENDASCRLHGTPEFPEVCKNYPTIYDDLSIVPDCSYRIANVPSPRSR